MEEKLSSSSGLPQEIPLRVLLGIGDPEGIDWGRIRVFQYEGVYEHGFFRMFGASICVLIAVQSSVSLVNGWLLGAWALALWATYIYFY
ncbi:MAG: hypothetical protein ACR2O7_00945, partial [Parasphingorhabdus sp.]